MNDCDTTGNGFSRTETVETPKEILRRRFPRLFVFLRTLKRSLLRQSQVDALGQTAPRVRIDIRNRLFRPLKAGYASGPLSQEGRSYDEYYQEDARRHTSSYGLQFVDAVCSNFSFRSILDAGCGSGIVVREFLKRRYLARGIELSDWVVKTGCPELYEGGIVQIGTLEDLPYKDNAFDLVFSSDVLEHIPERSIPRVVSELVRVAKRDLFLSINLRPSADNNAYHVTLRSRAWWEKTFADAGAVANVSLVRKLQKTSPGKSDREIVEMGPARSITVEMEWFFEQAPYSFEGELEPWVFAFSVGR